MRYSVNAFRKNSTEGITEAVMAYGLDAAHEAAEAMRELVKRDPRDGDSVEVRAGDAVLVAAWVWIAGATSGVWLAKPA